jgi:hypothetical protein
MPARIRPYQEKLMRMLDLFAGLGGASAAMSARGWEVVTVDNEPKFDCTHTADLTRWHYAGPPVDLVWASPPCTEFSRESMPWCRTGAVPSLDLVNAARRIIAEVKPTWWVVENVRGARKHVSPSLGEPQIYGPFFLWGTFPTFRCRVRGFKERLSSTARARRAKVPYALSLALAVACETQVRNLKLMGAT